MNLLKSKVKDWVPPALLSILRGLGNQGVKFQGDYPTWEDAALKCSGYDADNILSKVLEATLKVKCGEAVYERDSVLFDQVQYDWPVTAALMWAASQNKGKLNVLDFGGALGSSFFQNRQFLQSLSDVKWNVVEQKHYVAAGRQYIQDEQLRFYNTIQECAEYNWPNVILLSAVLQYLPNPISILEELLSLNADVVVLDKTIVNHTNYDKIFVQHVSDSICSASYPCWSFSESGLLEKLKRHYKLLTYFPSINFPALSSITSEFKGFVFTR